MTRRVKRPYRDPLAWMWLRNRFVALRASGANVTLREFGEKHGVALKALEERCWREKWLEQGERLKAQIDVAAELIRLHGLSPKVAVHEAGCRVR